MFQPLILICNVGWVPVEVPGGIWMRQNAVAQVTIWSACCISCSFWKKACSVGRISKWGFLLYGFIYRPSVLLTPSADKIWVGLEVRIASFTDSPATLLFHQWSVCEVTLSAYRKFVRDKFRFLKKMVMAIGKFWKSLVCGFCSCFGGCVCLNLSENF